jgi:hypothetical protein
MEPMWWEPILVGNGLYAISQCETSFLEVFAFFDPAHVTIIGGPWCGKQEASCRLLLSEACERVS